MNQRLSLIPDAEYEELLDEQQAIAFLKLNERRNPRGALLWLIRVHRLPVIRLCRGVNRFSERSLRRWLTRREVHDII